MLKTLIIESAESKKYVVWVGGCGKNRAKLIGKDEIEKDEVGSSEVNDKVDD